MTANLGIRIVLADTILVSTLRFLSCFLVGFPKFEWDDIDFKHYQYLSHTHTCGNVVRRTVDIQYKNNWYFINIILEI